LPFLLWQGDNRVIFNAHLSNIAREDALIATYLDRIRKICPYAYSVPVKEPREEAPGLPEDELAHYHLIFATRSPRAVVYMNDTGLSALQPFFDQFKEGFSGNNSQSRLFDVTPERHRRVSAEVAMEAIVEAAREKPITRVDIYEKVIPKFFMQHKKKVYRAWVDELRMAGRLNIDPTVRLNRNQINDKVRLWAKPWR
jgi:hypothetical protein